MIQDCEDYDRVEIYNLAAQSHVGVSFNCPKYTFEANTLGILNILETVRQNKHPEKFRVYQASTSEMFGKVQEIPQKETTPFYPRSVYGVSKMAAHWLVKNYRESYGIHASAGILFNHESPRRGIDFVTKKIVTALKNIFAGEQEYLELGNMDAKRDWGHALDYIEAMWMMLQQDNPDDYVVATGKTYSVREFVNMCCKQMNKEITWSGEAENEVGTCDGKVIVRVSKKFYRPCEVDLLVGDSTKVQNIGWNPKHNIESLIKDMIDN
jgi:GDPmannose 4,6-dehydratase